MLIKTTGQCLSDKRVGHSYVIHAGPPMIPYLDSTESSLHSTPHSLHSAACHWTPAFIKGTVATRSTATTTPPLWPTARSPDKRSGAELIDMERLRYAITG